MKGESSPNGEASVEATGSAFIVLVIVTTAGLSAETIDANEPAGATIPATVGVDEAAAKAEFVPRMIGAASGTAIMAAPTKARIRFL